MLELRHQQLWQGHALNARDPRPLFAAGIAAVVDLAYEEPPAQLPRQLTYCRFPLNDGGGNPQELLILAVETVLRLLRAQTPTLVACSAGMSRSPAVGAAALALHEHAPLHEVLTAIGEHKSLDLSPALWQDVATVHAILSRRARA